MILFILPVIDENIAYFYQQMLYCIIEITDFRFNKLNFNIFLKCYKIASKICEYACIT